MSEFLEVLRERVLVFDGATGTNLQLAGLTADDFGGPDLEGCMEILNRQRIGPVHETRQSRPVYEEVSSDRYAGSGKKA